MSTQFKRNNDDNGPSGRKIVLTQTEDGTGWVARDEDTGVASQGETRGEALIMLDEAVALHTGESEPLDPDEEREFLEELGIDADEVEAAREDADDLPEFMQ